MNRGVWVGFLLAVVLVLTGIGYYLYRGQADGGIETIEPVEETIAEVPVEETPPAAEIQYPVEPAETADNGDETQPSAPPLPALGDSDPEVREGLEQVFGKPPIDAYLIPRRIIERLVVAIDSLDGDPLPLRLRPVRHVPGRPEVRVVEDDQIVLDPRNGERYAPYISAFKAVDAEQLAALYLRYYPLFQQAYADLGFPDRYFNDRLIGIIDHLLRAPEVEGPIRLVRPKVLYRYADPELEDLSSGQKILVRMGTENARIVKQQLRDIRRAIIAGSAAVKSDLAEGAPADDAPVDDDSVED
ncbi:MAG: DUF3014 domain-containing protein [Nevskiales bacterium]|nr:DUF3014 domain-containing protein [Nevskiales bacterium]